MFIFFHNFLSIYRSDTFSLMTQNFQFFLYYLSLLLNFNIIRNMTQFVTNLSKTATTVPLNYVHPPNMVPEIDAPICKEIPVIDLSLALSSNVHDRAEVAEKLLKALDGSCGFQVINHGVSEKLMGDAMEVYKEFFNLPIEEKQKYVSDSTNPIRTGLFSGSDEHPAAKIHLWRDTLVQNCYPLEIHIDSWPEKPSLYRKVIAEYTSEIRKLTQKIFELIAEGLGLEKQFFHGKFTEYQTIRANYYPKSPNPRLTTGFSVHYDPNYVTFLQQSVSGLQILKDEQWVVVEPLPNAFFVIPGMELQIISNGRFKAPLHQVATNADVDRLSIGNFISVTQDLTVKEPESAFLSDENPPKYKDYSFEKYLKFLFMKLNEGEPKISLVAVSKSALDCFLI